MKYPIVLADDYGIRPAGKPDECFYCRSKVGEEHKHECVIVVKKVIVETTIRYETTVPASWDAHMIEFHRNESSSCANNVWAEIEQLSEKNGCLCGHLETKFIEVSDPTPIRSKN